MCSHFFIFKYFFELPKTREAYDRCASKTSKNIAIGSKLAEIDQKNLGVSNELGLTVYIKYRLYFPNKPAGLMRFRYRHNKVLFLAEKFVDQKDTLGRPLVCP